MYTRLTVVVAILMNTQFPPNSSKLTTTIRLGANEKLEDKIYF